MEEKKQLPRQQLFNLRHRRIESLTLQDAVLETQTRLTRISPILSDMPKGGGADGDKMADGISKLIEQKNKLNVMIDEIAEEEDAIIKNIKRMETTVYKTILYKLYILGDKLEKVSLDINYNYHYTCRLHGYALNEYDKIATDVN